MQTLTIFFKKKVAPGLDSPLTSYSIFAAGINPDNEQLFCKKARKAGRC